METPPLPTAATDSAIEIIDFPVERLVYARAMLLPLLIFILTGGIFSALIGFFANGPRAAMLQGLVLGASVGVGMVLFFRYINRQASKLPGDIPISNIAGHISRALENRNRWLVMARLFKITGELAKQSHHPAVIRIWPSETLTSVVPLNSPIEPLSLDEADSAFDELSEALGDSVQRSHINRYDATPLRRVRRNFALSGGWIIVFIFGFNTLVALFHTYHSRTPTVGLLIWPLLLCITLFDAKNSRGRAGLNTWLLVPGGLAVRSKKLWKNRSSSHVFEARTSLLCVLRVQKNTWYFIVADAERCEQRIATKRELDMLLRAWLSPLPPPALSQIESYWPS